MIHTLIVTLGTSICNNKKLIFDLWSLLFLRTLTKLWTGFICSVCTAFMSLRLSLAHSWLAASTLQKIEVRLFIQICPIMSVYPHPIWHMMTEKNFIFLYTDVQIKMAQMIQFAAEVKWRSKYSEMSFKEGGAEKTYLSNTLKGWDVYSFHCINCCESALLRVKLCADLLSAF